MNSPAMRTTLGITKALADLQRLRILMMLQPGELCVCQIVEVLALAPSTVSKHLSVLSAAGLVDFRKDGRWAYYRLTQGPSEASSVHPLLKWLGNRLAQDEGALRDQKKLKTVVACNPVSLSRKQRSQG